MPKISTYSPTALPAWGDRVLGVFDGTTDTVTLEILRELFGTGTNIIPVATYPLTDQANPIYGKSGDLLLALDTNKLYLKAANSFPPIGQPTAVLQGTRVNDSVISPDTSWSSQQIDQFIRSAVAVVLDLPVDTIKRVPFFNKVLLESLRVSLGPDSFMLRLLLANGTVVTTASGTGAACIGAISVAINSLTAVQCAAGYNVEFTNTGNAVTTALLRTIPV